MIRYTNRQALVVVVLFTLSVALMASGATTTHYWTNTLGGVFYTGANWNTGLNPQAADIVYFTNNMSAQVDVAGNVQLGGVYYNTTQGVITNNLSGVLNAGSSAIEIGSASGSAVKVVQIGAGFMSANLITVGKSGRGDLEVMGPTATYGYNMNVPVTYVVGYYAPESAFTVTNGAKIVTGLAVVGFDKASERNVATITGSGSAWTNTGNFYLGYDGAGQLVKVEKGGLLYAGSGVSLGWLSNCTNNTLLVTGSNSIVRAPGDSIIGYGSSALSNMIIVADGALFDMGGGNMHIGANSPNCVLQVTGAGSVFSNPGGTNKLSSCYNTLMVVEEGAFAQVKCIQNNNANANNQLLIKSRGVVEAEALLVNQPLNSITNNGGVFQFTSSTPLITGSGGNIVLTNGWISFRSVSDVDVKGNWSGTSLTNIAFQGANTFRLNAATNAPAVQDYVFAPERGASNYIGLELLNGAGWRGGSLTLGSGGRMLASNTSSSVDGALTNNGVLHLVNSTLVCSQAATLDGVLKIDLNQWASDGGLVVSNGLTIGASSVLELTGVYTNSAARELIRFTGARSGIFESVIGLPVGYAIIYDENGKVLLGRVRGTSLLIM